ncbi:hypothetical protein [Chitinophaga sp.]|uniref:hypothetical protein n=1 Tax=Chitinophaga sp. TaxID=1869181 RepID=UPI0031CFC7D8
MHVYTKLTVFIALLLCCRHGRTLAQGDGFIYKNGQRTFVFGSYYLPAADDTLKEMTDAGFNLFSCRNKQELDRLQKRGVQGWMWVHLHKGITPELKKTVTENAGHPALALWSGPDELVWNFTAHSKLYRKEGIHSVPGAWKKLTPEALAYGRQQAASLLPKLQEAAAYVRSADRGNLQIWMNEAEASDMAYVGDYMNAIDIAGCDIYPIKTRLPAGSTAPRKEIQIIGKATRKWTAISQQKPVWMVLQGFSWNELLAVEPENAVGRPVAYPSFEESRFMAYDAIANGAAGILYWDMRYLTSDPFRQSLYGLAREFKALQPLLSTEPKAVTVTAWQPELSGDNRVAATARQYGRDWMVVIVNSADTSQLAAVVQDLHLLNGQQLVELYGTDEVQVKNGQFVTRLRPFQVKVFATGRKWETANKKGRDYAGQ